MALRNRELHSRNDDDHVIGGTSLIYSDGFSETTDTVSVIPLKLFYRDH